MRTENKVFENINFTNTICLRFIKSVDVTLFPKI